MTSQFLACSTGFHRLNGLPRLALRALDIPGQSIAMILGLSPASTSRALRGLQGLRAERVRTLAGYLAVAPAGIIDPRPRSEDLEALAAWQASGAAREAVVRLRVLGLLPARSQP